MKVTHKCKIYFCILVLNLFHERMNYYVFYDHDNDVKFPNYSI